eukprot:scaffold319664_cov36-Tisochrysis_lutea.AAC.3
MAPRFCRCAQAGRRARLYSLACHLLDRSCRSQQRRSPRGPHPSGSETCRGHGLPCPGHGRRGWRLVDARGSVRMRQWNGLGSTSL